jgi:hypothetical protein
MVKAAAAGNGGNKSKGGGSHQSRSAVRVAAVADMMCNSPR